MTVKEKNQDTESHLFKMTSEELAASVFVGMGSGKMIPSQSVGDENRLRNSGCDVNEGMLAADPMSILQCPPDIPKDLQGIAHSVRPVMSVAQLTAKYNAASGMEFKGSAMGTPSSNVRCQNGNRCTSKKCDSSLFLEKLKPRKLQTDKGTHWNPEIGPSFLGEGIKKEESTSLEKTSINVPSLCNRTVMEDSCTNGGLKIKLHASCENKQNHIFYHGQCSQETSIFHVDEDYQSSTSSCASNMLLQFPKDYIGEGGHNHNYSCPSLRATQGGVSTELRKLKLKPLTEKFVAGHLVNRSPLKPSESYLEDSDVACDEGMEGAFNRNKKERSTLLFRRYNKNNREVKKSVYTGSKARTRRLPSGHIGAKAREAVSQNRNIRPDVKVPRVSSEKLMMCQAILMTDNWTRPSRFKVFEHSEVLKKLFTGFEPDTDIDYNQHFDDKLYVFIRDDDN